MFRRLLVMTFLAVGLVGQPAPQQPPPLPDQDVVFVIDNSSSMEAGLQASDPLRLRGVAACLILDAIELSSNVKAGLVLFSNGNETDNQLNPPDVIRQRLRPDRLAPDGGTNMQPALAAAIAILGNSSAAKRRIVLITDGMPDGNQAQTIPLEIVPAAQQSGIEIFAIGVSANVAQAFLDQITLPTGGRTLIALKHTELLQIAKKLVGNLDNVFTLKEDKMAGNQADYPFTVPGGVDRVRLTAILDDPKEFEPGEIELRLDGPSTADDATYSIRPSGSDRVAAWTAFFSSPGDYTLHVTTTKPASHAMQVFIEALSSLRLTLDVVPKETRFTFDDEVRVEASAITGTGPVDPASLKLTGSIRTPSGGTVAFPFNGTTGVFKVPHMPGRQTIVVRAETPLSRTEASYEYEAIPPCAPQFKTDRQELVFDNNKKLGPEHPTVEEAFKLYAEFPGCTKSRSVTFSFTVNSTVGVVELVKKGGGVLKPGPGSSYTLPPAGLELAVRVRLDPKAPLPPKEGTYDGQLYIVSSETAGLRIPFSLVLRIPRFEVTGQPKAFALWWDPLRERTLDLGKLKSDLSVPSQYFVTIPEAIHAPDQGPKIADLVLRVGDTSPEPERLDDGRLRYGPLELLPGKSVPLTLVVTPSRDTGWQNLKRSSSPLKIDVASALGMTTRIEPVFWTVHGPRGVILALGVVLLLGLLAIAFRTAVTGNEVRRFWKYRPKSILVLGSGPILVDDPNSAGTAALVLPKWRSELDGETLGTVTDNGRQQTIANAAPQLQLVRQPLKPGDPINVIDPADDSGMTNAWELEYGGFDRSEGGELEVMRNPARWTLGRMLRRLLMALLILGAVVWFVRSGPMARLAYHTPFIESLYAK